MKRPAPATAISIAALVVALGGTSYAAAGQIQKEDIARNAVTAGKIAEGAVASSEVKDGSIRKSDLAPTAGARWLYVTADGTIGAQSGGFSIVAAYPTLPNTAPDGSPDNSLRANGNVYINANEDVSDNGIVASLTLQNTVEQNGTGTPGFGNTSGRATGPDANPEFSGEITVSPCNVGAPTTPPSGPTNCAPTDAQNANSFVVSPRMSDGSVTVDGDDTAANPSTRKGFYVVLTP